MRTQVRPVKSIRERDQALALLVPLRLDLMQLAVQPISATEAAQQLSLPRQRVNYHVRELAKHGLLRKAGRRQKRNMTEQLYRSVASSFVLAPELLGPLAEQLPSTRSAVSIAELLRLANSMQRDVVELLETASSDEEDVPSLSLQSQVALSGPEERARFASALQEALSDVIRRFSKQPTDTDAAEGAGEERTYRLVLGCYPSPENQQSPAAESEH